MNDNNGLSVEVFECLNIADPGWILCLIDQKTREVRAVCGPSADPRSHPLQHACYLALPGTIKMDVPNPGVEFGTPIGLVDDKGTPWILTGDADQPSSYEDAMTFLHNPGVVAAIHEAKKSTSRWFPERQQVGSFLHWTQILNPLPMSDEDDGNG